MHLRQSDLNKINANSVASNHVKCQKPRSKKRKWVRKAKENDFLERCGNVSESCLMFGYLIFVFFIIDISFCCKLRLLCCLYYTAKNAQVITTTSLLSSCNNLSEQGDIRMCSHGFCDSLLTTNLLQDINTLVAS